mgnify:CR=1 FL=1
MKKYFSITIILTLILILSCDKDDICLENTTPNLVLKFYDINNDTLAKPVTSLTVWANELDTIYLDKPFDSIIIPLDFNLNKKVVFLGNIFYYNEVRRLEDDVAISLRSKR